MSTASLHELVRMYQSSHDYGLAEGTVNQYLWSVQALEHWKGKPLTVADLCDELINGYIDWMRDNRAPDTVRTRRGNLLTLWRFAWAEALTEVAPRKVRRLKRRRTIPTAWTPEEVARLARHCQSLDGAWKRTQVERRLFWRSLVLAGWDTGLRLGDLLAIERGSIQADGSLVVRQSKTGDELCVRLLPETVAAIDECLADPPRRLIWPLWARRDQFYADFKQIVADAGIRMGTFKWIRRGSITSVERQQRGAGTTHAGHRTRAVTEASYIDTRQIDEDRPQPPSLQDQDPDRDAPE